MSKMLKSSGAMGFATLVSRLLGLVREQVYANFMGDSALAGAFKLAYQIPNLFRRLLGEGALTAAFVPIFKDKEAREGESQMWRAANAVISGLLVAAGVVVGLAMLGVTLVLAVCRGAPGGGGLAAWLHLPILGSDTRLMLELLRIMFPYLLLVCLAALCVGMLNARGYFFIPAMGATMLNVVMIATVVVVAPRFGATREEQIYALAWGVLAAGVAQFLFQMPTLHRQGFRYRWVRPWGDETVKEVVRRMLPGTLGVAAYQINVLLVQSIAFWVSPSVVASFDYAVRLMEFPQGIVGISLATYLLSALSGLAARKEYPGFCSTLKEGLEHLVFVNLLASVLLVALAEPIVRLLFERGQFGPAATANAAGALAGLAPGLVLFSTVNLLARAFYALGDTQTPMRISVCSLALNLAFAALLVVPLRQTGLGLANTLSSMLGVWLLHRALRKKLSRLDLGEVRRLVLRLLGPAAAAGAVAWLGAHWWRLNWGHQRLGTRLGEVFLPLLAATALYWGLALWLRVPQARQLAELILGRFRRSSPD